MRARAGDPPRTMAQKILSARSGELTFAGGHAEGMVRAEVDQIVLARAPARALAAALAAGRKKPSAEVPLASAPRSIASRPARGVDETSTRASSAELLSHGILVARAGVGFPGPVQIGRAHV